MSHSEYDPNLAILSLTLLHFDFVRAFRYEKHDGSEKSSHAKKRLHMSHIINVLPLFLSACKTNHHPIPEHKYMTV